ncbi:MAG: hypothetical protein ACLQVY_11495 [Limisphaerales bacterium]
MRCWQLESALENLGGSGYDQRAVSRQTLGRVGYNCIAYAAGDTEKRWWPHPNKFAAFWPEHLPREPLNAETLENFIRAFEWKGYKRGCPDGELKEGIEKVAIFALGGRPTHAARQLESGYWTSKCGFLEDIEHPTLAAVEGKAYGKAVIFLHRRRDGTPLLDND